MNVRDTGGNAFPTVVTEYNRDNEKREVTSEGGMTLLDWFAGKAMQSIYAAALPSGRETNYADAARAAYLAADAMLAERAK
jgi:hypothetical protein